MELEGSRALRPQYSGYIQVPCWHFAINKWVLGCNLGTRSLKGSPSLAWRLPNSPPLVELDSLLLIGAREGLPSLGLLGDVGIDGLPHPLASILGPHLASRAPFVTDAMKKI